MTDNSQEDERRKANLIAVTRRQALAMTLAAGVSATSITLALTEPAEAAASGLFLHGVASGDPLADRVILWTRITSQDAGAAFAVRWTVATDRSMRNVVRFGNATAHVDRDYTVKVDVTGLSAGQTYFYRFDCEGQSSPIGRTRTLPTGDVERLKFAVFSCSNFELGLFNAYREASHYDDLDAVLHLGDYIYEYGPGVGGYTTPAAALGLVPKPRDAQLQPREEIVVLDQYRARHALYRTDAWLQRVHRMNPMIVVWDDHEVTNDSWRDGAQNHQPDTEGRFRARRKAGVRAFYEWLPVREPKDGNPIDSATGTADDLYRSFDYGNLARLVMIDTRHAERDQQLDTARLVAAYAGAPAQGPFPNDRTDDGRTRTLLGDQQSRWVDHRLRTSPQTWQLIGNQVLMHYQGAPDLLGSTLLTPALRQQLIGLLDSLFGPGGGQALAELGAAGLPFPEAADAWTGYPSARIDMLEMLAKAKNPVVLTGDSHNAWTANLVLPTTDGGLPVGVEFGTTSVSSPGYEQILVGVPPALVAGLLVDTSTRKSESDKLVYAETERRGFMLLDVTARRVTVDHVFVSTVFETNYTVQKKRFRVFEGTNEVEEV